MCGSISKVEGKLAVAEEVESAAVVRRGAMFLDALSVLLGGIAGIVVPTVVRVLLVELLHVVVTIGLGKDGGGSDGEILAIAFHDGGVRKGMAQLSIVAVFVIGVESVAIDDEGSGRTERASMALCMAVMLARRMFIWSISSAVTMPNAHAMASRWISSRSA